MHPLPIKTNQLCLTHVETSRKVILFFFATDWTIKVLLSWVLYYYPSLWKGWDGESQELPLPSKCVFASAVYLKVTLCSTPSVERQVGGWWRERNAPLNVREGNIRLSTPRLSILFSRFLSWVFPLHGAHLLFKAAGRNAFKLTGAESPDIC